MAEEYTYDDNGNMIADANKGISSISYNHLNLPTRVVTPEGVVNYTYTSTGTKLTKFFDKSSGAEETTDYIAAIQYKDDIRDFAPHGEGRYYFASGEYNYDLKDHLGNTRVTLDGTGTVVQRDDYYPFGGRFNSYTSGSPNDYLYNGMEFQNETQWYDYGARMHDPWLGRWMVVDPLAEQARRWSPYAYAFDNPIRFIDPDGMMGQDATCPDCPPAEPAEVEAEVMQELGEPVEQFLDFVMSFFESAEDFSHDVGRAGDNAVTGNEKSDVGVEEHRDFGVILVSEDANTMNEERATASNTEEVYADDIDPEKNISEAIGAKKNVQAAEYGQDSAVTFKYSDNYPTLRAKNNMGGYSVKGREIKSKKDSAGLEWKLGNRKWKGY